jgi:hypothetical protein
MSESLLSAGCLPTVRPHAYPPVIAGRSARARTAEPAPSSCGQPTRKTLRERRTVPLITELVEPFRDRLAMEQEHRRGKPADWVFSIDGHHVIYAAFACG